MSLPFELFLYGVAFFGFMAVVNAVQAYRKKEKAYYLAAMLGFVVVLAFVFAFFNQLILALILVIAAGILSIAALPKTMKAARRELAKQLQTADLSAPLRVRDFFTNVGWLKLASKWGLWKTMCFFYLLSVVIIGGIFFILSIFYNFITIGYIVSYAAAVSIFVTFLFYQQIKKVLEKRMKAHIEPSSA